MAAGAVYDSDLYDNQQRSMRIPSFDPTKPEDYELWDSRFLSFLSAGAKACLEHGPPNRHMALEYVGPTANRSDIDTVLESLYTNYDKCSVEIYDKLLQTIRWGDSQEGRSATG